MIVGIGNEVVCLFVFWSCDFENYDDGVVCGIWIWVSGVEEFVVVIDENVI